MIGDVRRAGAFAYVNPGHQTDAELHSWGAAHGPLWDALRKKGRQVRVIGIRVENATADRTARVLEAWAAAEPETPDEGLTVKQEIKAIDEAMVGEDEEFLARYGDSRKLGDGLWNSNAAPKPRSRKESRLTTIQHGGPSGLQIGMRLAERRINPALFVELRAAWLMERAQRGGGGVPRITQEVFHNRFLLSLSFRCGYPL